jgi:hypothetical protein
MLSAEELLAGGSLTFEVEVPAEVLRPAGGDGAPTTLRLRPLTVRDLQLVSRAAKESDTLTATLMVQRALVEPEMSIAQVSAMHVGLLQFLLEQVNRVSGITATSEQLSDAVEAPLAKAAFVLAQEFGWTPQQVNELTLGQVLLHLQMLKERSRQSDAR